MSYTSMMAHIIFSTKNRQPFLNQTFQSRLIPYIGGIIRSLKSTMLDANGPDDHLHIAAIVSPTISTSELLKTIKGNSTSWVHETFTEMQDFYWQGEYAAFSVSPSKMPDIFATSKSIIARYRLWTN